MISAGDGTYFVRPAHRLSDLTDDNFGLVRKLYGDTLGLWKGKQSWHMGFNNVGQAMKEAGLILDDSDRTEGDVVASKKVLFLTKGLRAGCTVFKSVAEQYKNKGMKIDLVLFSGTYESNPSQFEVLEEAVSYPSHAHFHVVGPLSKLNDWSFRAQTAQSLIPNVCPAAVSVSTTFKKHCDAGVQLLHRGRTCHDWTYELCNDGPVDLQACRNLAVDKGFSAFIHTDLAHASDSEAATECNCMAKIKKKEQDENGQDKPGQKDVPHEDATGPQFDPKTKLPLETTCKNQQKQEEGGEKNGWLHQAFAAGNGDMTSHYAVIQQSECLRPWSSLRWKVFLRRPDYKKYFAGAK